MSPMILKDTVLSVILLPKKLGKIKHFKKILIEIIPPLEFSSSVIIYKL